ncbi:MAG: rhodanese-like domain-containing protein [Parasphingorhabdus sp.]
MRSIFMSTTFVLSLIQAASALAIDAPETPRVLQPNEQVDYAAFASLTAKLQEFRAKRLISMDQFSDLATQDNAIILDTRSAAAFQAGHINGAINLPFSDFTEEKLTQVLGDKNRPILIYCNNNFRDNAFPVARKSAPLALNIPTFINLYGYGFKNIYELNDVVAMSDPRLEWVGLSLDDQI